MELVWCVLSVRWGCIGVGGGRGVWGDCGGRVIDVWWFWVVFGVRGGGVGFVGVLCGLLMSFGGIVYCCRLGWNVVVFYGWGEKGNGLGMNFWMLF